MLERVGRPRLMRVHEERLSRLRGLLASGGIDLAVIGPTANMRYLLGGSPFGDERFCALFVDDAGARAVIPSINVETVSAFATLEQLPWDDAGGPDSAIRRAARGSVRVLGVDGAMRADFLVRLLGILEPAAVRPLDPLVFELRKRKSLDEIEALTRAALQADEAVRRTFAAARPGVTERELAWAAEKAFRELGAERASFTLVAFGEHAASPHHDAGDRPLARGECVLVDIGASLGGYQSDVTRVAFLGEPSREFERLYGIVLEANRAGRAAVRPGVPLGDVDGAARAVIERAGYGERFIHRTGHGIGLDVHEAPWVTPGNASRVEEGMVFSVEPGVYLTGKFGIRIEDIVAVTGSGARVLTGFPRELAVFSP